MDLRPIGIFDSGVGGLTAVRVMQAQAANERVIYFGDTARVPYGNRTKENITELSLQDVRFLRSYDPKAILIACNTITASCMDVLMKENPEIPIFGVILPAAAAAAVATKNHSIGIIATKATVSSGAYDLELKRILPDIQIFAQACPRLVPLIESGHIHPGDAFVERAAAEYLGPLKTLGVDTVILGCTHYSLIQEIVQNYMGPDTALIDSGKEAVLSLLEVLQKNGERAPTGKESDRYFCSARKDDFEKIARVFLRKDIHESVEQINIKQY